MSGPTVLTWLTLIPLFGGVAVLVLRRAPRQLTSAVGVGASFVALAVAISLWFRFNPHVGALQLVQRGPWIPSIHVEYFLGVDGLGLLMVSLTALLVPMALLVSRGIQERKPLYIALILFLETGLFGTFTAQNFFHWFLFWELSLVPAFFLIRLWGGPARGPAATQFFIYTMVGSVAMLLGFLALYLATGQFNFTDLAQLAAEHRIEPLLAAHLGDWLSPRALGMLVFGGIFLGLAVKVPVMPFHTWLPSAYAEAPSPVTMLLTGLMSKMGMYAFLRILVPIFPAETRAVLSLLLVLAVATIVFSAAAAFAQTDLKRMLAYSSINHLGYCLLGTFVLLRAGGGLTHPALERAAALSGVQLQMFNHGLTAATLFAFMAFIEERSGGCRLLNDFGGLRTVAPIFTGLMGIATFASLGLPGLNGFVSEFLIFKGAFALAPWAAAVSVLGLLITAVFLLTFMQRVFHGPLNPRWAAFRELTWRERGIVAPAIALMFLLGIWPQAVLGVLHATVRSAVAILGR